MADQVRPGEPRLARSGSPQSADGRSDPTDAELVARLGTGDSTALSELYRRYGRPAYSLARRVCVDDGLAEDVVQEVFLAVWHHPTRFDPHRGSFSSWLLTVVHHKAVDVVRREAAIRRRTVYAADAGQEWSPTPLPGADHTALDRVAASEVRDLLLELPADQRRALALAYYGGHTQREVAAIMDVPLGTVKSRMFAGVARLRALMDRDGSGARAAEGGL